VEITDKIYRSIMRKQMIQIILIAITVVSMPCAVYLLYLPSDSNHENIAVQANGKQEERNSDKIFFLKEISNSVANDDILIFGGNKKIFPRDIRLGYFFYLLEKMIEKNEIEKISGISNFGFSPTMVISFVDKNTPEKDGFYVPKTQIICFINSSSLRENGYIGVAYVSIHNGGNYRIKGYMELLFVAKMIFDNEEENVENILKKHGLEKSAMVEKSKSWLKDRTNVRFRNPADQTASAGESDTSLSE